jgi:ABC-type multidrug transport system fused ATPase/permease subunit
VRIILKKLLHFLRDYRKESILAPAFKMLEAIFELLVPVAVTVIIDDGINGGNTAKIWQMCGVMLILAVVGLISAVCAQFFAAKAAVGFAAKVRSALFKKVQGFSYGVTDKLGVSTLITRMTSDINSVQTGVNMFLRLFMRSPFIVFGAMICALIIDVKLGFIFIGVIVILAIIVFGIMLISIAIHKKTQKRLDGVVSKVRENYNGVRVVRAFNKEQDEIKDFDEKIDSLTKIQRFAGRISALMNPLTYAVINIAIILLIKNGALQVNYGNITQGELIALYNYMSQILVELIKLASLIITLNKAAASAQRISDVLETPRDVEFNVRKDYSDEDYAVKFENVSFKYSNESDDNVIESISFAVKNGETVGIIGGTGSGKTTLANLIAGFYHATGGNAFVYGKNASLLTESDRKSIFGIVPQKATLFAGTIRSNLLFGDENASDEELWEALALAKAKDFVLEKTNGLDEEVLQNGTNFSGGQRQRLTIARALTRKPKILILDDSSSALDYATEAALRKNIASLDYSPTVFIISQRASSIMHADTIIVLDDGVAVGIGKHSELLESCDIYKEIYDTQFSKGGEQK